MACSDAVEALLGRPIAESPLGVYVRILDIPHVYTEVRYLQYPSLDPD